MKGPDKDAKGKVVREIEEDEIESQDIVSNNKRLTPGLLPLPYIPATYWIDIDRTINAVLKLRRTRTILWSFGCDEAVWGYAGVTLIATSQQCDHMLRTNLAFTVRQRMRRPTTLRQLMRRAWWLTKTLRYSSTCHP